MLYSTHLPVALAALLTLMGASARSAQADNGVERGGGHYVTLPDGSFDLADATLIRFGERTHLSKPLIVELDRASRLFALLGADRDPRTPNEPFAGFFNEFVFNDLVDYRLTDKIPPSCSPHADGYAQDAALVGCTEGPVTWLLKPVFEKMSTRAQAKTIIHERIHSRPHAAPEEYIADLTTGIDLALSLQQAQERGERPSLPSDQVNTLQTFVRRLAQMKFGKRYVDYRVTAQGGLVSPSSHIHPSAYVGIGTLFNGRADQGAVVLDSVCDAPLSCTLFPKAALMHSWIGEGTPGSRPFDFELGDRALISDSVIGLHDEGATSFVQIVGDAKITSSRLLDFAGISLGAGAEISNTQLQALPYEEYSTYPRLLLYPFSALKNVALTTLRGKPRNSRYGFGRAQLPTLKVKRSVIVDHGNQPFCPAPYFQYVSGWNLIRFPTETNDYCRK